LRIDFKLKMTTLRARHAAVAKALQDAFGVPAEEAAAAVRAHQADLAGLLDGTAPGKLLVLHQPPSKHTEVRSAAVTAAAAPTPWLLRRGMAQEQARYCNRCGSMHAFGMC
jgi:hypothetical protein